MSATKRKRNDDGVTMWPMPAAAENASDGAAGAAVGSSSSLLPPLDTPNSAGDAAASKRPRTDGSGSDVAVAASAASAATDGATGGDAAPLLSRGKSHLKRPEGLALHDLQVPLVGPSGVPKNMGAADNASATNGNGEAEGGVDGGPGSALDDLDVPLFDVATALSPLLASSLGLPPASMRSFLRLDDLTSDLLSPLGSANRFPKPNPEGE